MVIELRAFKVSSPSNGMLLAIGNVTKSIKIYPKLPKVAKICQNLPKDN
jgi:hypothetical protein